MAFISRHSVLLCVRRLICVVKPIRLERLSSRPFPGRYQTQTTAGPGEIKRSVPGDGWPTDREREGTTAGAGNNTVSQCFTVTYIVIAPKGALFVRLSSCPVHCQKQLKVTQREFANFMNGDVGRSAQSD